MVKVNYLPNSKVSEKLVKSLYKKATIKIAIYLILSIGISAFIFTKDDFAFKIIAIGVILNYLYRLYKNIQYPKKFVKKIEAGLLSDEFSIDDHEYTMKSMYTYGETIFTLKLSTIDSVFYSNEGLLMVSSIGLIFVLDGKYEAGSLNEIIDILSKYPTIKITKI